MQVNLNDTNLVVALGEAGEIVVDMPRLLASEAVVNYVFAYGLRQMLNDVHAGMTRKVEADDEKRRANKLALAEKKLASLYEGQVAQTRVAGGASPVEREMKAMAEADVKAKIRAAGRKISDFSKENLAKAIERHMEANAEAYRKAAEAKLAIKPEAQEAPADIMALLGLAEELEAADRKEDNAPAE